MKAWSLTLAVLSLGALVAGAQDPAKQSELRYIDTHNHLQGQLGPRSNRTDYEGAARRALTTMDRVGIRKMLLMPPPMPADFERPYDYKVLAKVVKKHPDRFGFLGGGGTLNPMIQEAVKAGSVTEHMKRKFRQKAEEIARAGAVGFGETTAEHISFNPSHPYVSAPPDHELFLLLADIAAEHGIPIDLHMEAVPKDMPLPERFKSPPNPKRLKANIAAFERLLAHNRKAKIVWVHLGWDNTGHRTPELVGKLLKKHSNLYLSLRVASRDLGQGLPVDARGKLKKPWVELIREFPDRFLIGSDEAYLSPGNRTGRHGSTGSGEKTVAAISKLPDGLARKVGTENPKRIFKLN